ncbi:MAG: hypothetical protein PWQ70_3296 [Clostridiales bacterium]|nr:hypothetical protein [Clostridiales bacterium]
MTWRIPLFDLNFGKEEESAIIEVLKSKWISMGDKTKEFEQRFAELLGVKHAIAVTNCTAALHMAMVVLGIGPEDEVIVPSFTFVATVNAVKYVGATPVFADITSLEDLTISPSDIRKKITNRTKAIVVMHYGGFACDMDEIMKIASENNLFVIEDAAHSPLATYKNKSLGTFGDISAFSFFSNKNITTAEGGMFVTNNDEYAKKARLIRSHGMTTMSFDRFKGHATKYDVVELGYNYRLDNIRSAIGLAQLKKLTADVSKRLELVQAYHQRLSQLDSIIIPFIGKETSSSNYIFPIVLKKECKISRDDFRGALASYGIQTSVHYPAVHEFSIYSDESVKLPITEYVTRNEVTLPLYYSMTRNDVNYVCDAIEKILEGNKI